MFSRSWNSFEEIHGQRRPQVQKTFFPSVTAFELIVSTYPRSLCSVSARTPEGRISKEQTIEALFVGSSQFKLETQHTATKWTAGMKSARDSKRVKTYTSQVQRRIPLSPQKFSPHLRGSSSQKKNGNRAESKKFRIVVPSFLDKDIIYFARVLVVLSRKYRQSFRGHRK